MVSTLEPINLITCLLVSKLAFSNGSTRYNTVRLANEAEEQNKMDRLEEEAAREAEKARSGQIFGTQLNPKASAAIAAAAAAAAAAAQEAGLPPIPLKFLRDKVGGCTIP
jgi:N12 class adenine-specific DNA methylase